MAGTQGNCSMTVNGMDLGSEWKVSVYYWKCSKLTPLQKNIFKYN
jgi:hypothetical protein